MIEVDAIPQTGVWRGLSWLLALVPAVILIWLSWTCTVEIPYKDQWELVPLLAKASGSGLSPGDFWEQHNEHRLVFPRMILVPLALATGWSIHAEVAVNLVLGGVLFGLAVEMFRVGQVGMRGKGGVVWIPFVAWMVFGLQQWENWTWGWQIQIFLNMAAVWGGAILFARAWGWPEFLLAVAAGVIATFSFANGLAYWLIGAWFLWRIIPDARRYLGVWLVVTVGVMVLYFAGYHGSPDHPPLEETFRHPVAYVEYVLIYLGSSVAYFHPRAGWVAGGVSLILFVVFWRGYLQENVEGKRHLAPAAFMAWYAVLSAMVTGLGRAGMGSWQAASSRYTTISQGLWLALFLGLYLSIKRRRPGRVWKTGLMGVMILSLLGGDYVGGWMMKQRQKKLRQARADILLNTPGDAFWGLYPRREALVERLAVLEKNGWSLYRREDAGRYVNPR